MVLFVVRMRCRPLAGRLEHECPEHQHQHIREPSCWGNTCSINSCSVSCRPVQVLVFAAHALSPCSCAGVFERRVVHSICCRVLSLPQDGYRPLFSTRV